MAQAKEFTVGDVLQLNDAKRRVRRLLVERAVTNGWCPNGRTGIYISRSSGSIELFTASLEDGVQIRSIVEAAGSIELASEEVLHRSGIAGWLIV